jgi:hypothetical protein
MLYVTTLFEQQMQFELVIVAKLYSCGRTANKPLSVLVCLDIEGTKDYLYLFSFVSKSDLPQKCRYT